MDRKCCHIICDKSRYPLVGPDAHFKTISRAAKRITPQGRVQLELDQKETKLDRVGGGLPYDAYR